MFEFKLTLNEANTILAALGQNKYVEVAALIDNIKAQAQPQLERVQAEMEAEAAQAKQAEQEAA